MHNVSKLIALLFCAGLATGLALTASAAPCEPVFSMLAPPEVTAGKTSTVTLLGSCMPADLVVGFQSGPGGTLRLNSSLPITIRQIR